MRFPDVIIDGNGALLVPAIRSSATFLDGFGNFRPVWTIDASGSAKMNALQVNTITAGYGASVARGVDLWARNLTWGTGAPYAVTAGAADSAGVGFKQLRVPNAAP